MDSYIETAQTKTTTTFFQKVYGRMFGGLLISGITAYFIAVTPAVSTALMANSGLFFVVIIAQLLLVIGLAAAINRMSADVAIFMFLVYCFMTGVTLSAIFLVYSTASITNAFFMTAGTFGVMSLYGMITKTDLSKMGQIFIMGLFGIIIASVVNMFLRSPATDFIVSILAVLIFVGLTAYDTQKLKVISARTEVGSENEMKLSIIGALTLYLDFINLFLQLLRLFGKRK